MIEPIAVTKAGAAQALGVSERLVEELIARHEFPVLRLGQRVVIPLAALREWSTSRALAAVKNEDAQLHHHQLSVQEASTSGRRHRAV